MCVTGEKSSFRGTGGSPTPVAMRPQVEPTADDVPSEASVIAAVDTPEEVRSSSGDEKAGGGGGNNGKAGEGSPKPRRPLNAYNFFFSYLRVRFLKLSEEEGGGGGGGGSDIPLAHRLFPLPPDLTTDDVRYALESGPCLIDGPKRRHRKSHGKISFKELTHIVSSGWKTLSDDMKKAFYELAAEHRAKHGQDIAEHKKQMRLVRERKRKEATLGAEAVISDGSCMEKPSKKARKSGKASTGKGGKKTRRKSKKDKKSRCGDKTEKEVSSGEVGSGSSNSKAASILMTLQQPAANGPPVPHNPATPLYPSAENGNKPQVTTETAHASLLPAFSRAPPPPPPPLVSAPAPVAAPVPVAPVIVEAKCPHCQCSFRRPYYEVAPPPPSYGTVLRAHAAYNPATNAAATSAFVKAEEATTHAVQHAHHEESPRRVSGGGAFSPTEVVARPELFPNRKGSARRCVSDSSASEGGEGRGISPLHYPPTPAESSPPLSTGGGGVAAAASDAHPGDESWLKEITSGLIDTDAIERDIISTLCQMHNSEQPMDLTAPLTYPHPRVVGGGGAEVGLGAGGTGGLVSMATRPSATRPAPPPASAPSPSVQVPAPVTPVPSPQVKGLVW